MKTFVHIVFIALLSPKLIVSQTSLFKDQNKWGLKDNEKIISPALYDTIFNFDASGSVCLACFKTTMASPNKFIKVTTTVYSCNYMNGQGRRLAVKAEGNDTCSIFIMGKTTVKAYNDNSSFFTVSVKGKKYLVSKDFKQLTFKGYADIMLAPDANYYIAQILNEGGVTLTGLIDKQENEVIPFNYSDIKMNRYDSLIVCCSAGVRPNGNDDVFNYKGEKAGSYRQHIDLATKDFVIHKIFEPKEYYVIYNLATKEEKNLIADEIRPSLHNEILMRVKNDWYLYDLSTNQKKPFKPS